MRLGKFQRSLVFTLDYTYTEEELKDVIGYIKWKLKALGIFCLITLPVVPMLILLYFFFSIIFSEKFHDPYKETFFDNLKENISILFFPPKTISSGPAVIRDSKGNVVQNVTRYFSNPNNNYRGNKQ